LPHIMHKKTFALGLVSTVVFFLLAGDTPVRGWIISHGFNTSTLNNIANVSGIIGILLLFISVSRISIDDDLGEPRVNIGVPVWLVLGVAGALAFNIIARVVAHLLSSQASNITVLGYSALIFILIAVPLGLVLEKLLGGRSRVRVFVVFKRVDAGREGEE